MACSKPLNYDKLYAYLNDENALIEFLRAQNVLFSFEGKCELCDGDVVLRRDKSASKEGLIWHCCHRRCNFKVSLRKYSFFARSHLSLTDITKIIYYWTYKYAQEVVIHETGLSAKTIVDFYNFLREVCCVVLLSLIHI